MSLHRSPPKRFDSDPNLSNSYQQRKRRHDDDFSELFKEFTSNIMDKLENWKTEVLEKVSELSCNIASVQEYLLCKLRTASQELKTEINGINSNYLKMRSVMQDMKDEHKKINSDIEMFRSSIQFHSSKHDDFSKNLQVINEDTKKITIIESNLDQVKKENRILKQQLNVSDQRDRLMNIEVIGIPESVGESPIELIRKLGEITNVDIKTTDIIYASRITSKNKIKGRPRILIARLSSRLLKDNIISAARKLRLTTKDFGLGSEVKPVYINENLTPLNKYLLKKSRDLAKAKEYQYVWAKNGRIYVRKNDTSPPVQLLDEEDLTSKIS